MNLTPKQLKILQLIRDYRVRRGYSPTMQELADEIGVSKVTVFEHVEALIKKGALTRDPNKARSLSIADGIAVPDESRPFRFPLVGKIAAGYPIEKVEDRDELDLLEDREELLVEVDDPELAPRATGKPRSTWRPVAPWRG